MKITTAKTITAATADTTADFLVRLVCPVLAGDPVC